MPDVFDLEIEKLSSPEVKKQRLAHEAAERKKAAQRTARSTGPPETNPVPLDERQLISGRRGSGLPPDRRRGGDPAATEAVPPTEPRHMSE